MLFNQHRQIMEAIAELQKEIQAMATNPLPGLTALTQAVSDLTAAISAAATEIGDAVASLQSSEDPQVQTAAAAIETQVTALQTATASLQAALNPTPVTPPASSSRL
jgi:chromosome segregation ATPase